MSQNTSWGNPQPWPSQPVAAPDKFAGWTRDQMLLEWDRRKKALETAKADELEIRNAIAKREFPNPKQGTNTLELGNGYKLKMVAKTNYNLDKDNEKVEDAQERIEKLGNEGAFLADRLITWKPSLSLTEYKNLDPTNPTHKKIKAIVDSVLTTSEATPSLEIAEPKGSKS